MMNLLKFLFVFTAFQLGSVAQAADIAGSKDPAGIKRYRGSEIIRFEQRQFDQYVVPLGKTIKFDAATKIAEFEKSERLEGELTRVSYRIPDPLRSSLEVYRNYESDFTGSGWEILFRASGKAQYGNTYTRVYESLKGNDQLFTYNDASGHLLVARKPEAGLTAVLFVTNFQQGLRGGVSVEKEEPIVQLDVIATKKMDQNMVVVTSSEMEQSMNQGGRVSLYGILFDFNQAEIKPASEPTLAQIGELLSKNLSLKLLVVGHTDNVGGFDFNRQLSAKRAESVVSALTTRYNVQANRLTPFGASYAAPIASNDAEEGRAKNRRVELVPH